MRRARPWGRVSVATRARSPDPAHRRISTHRVRACAAWGNGSQWRWRRWAYSSLLSRAGAPVAGDAALRRRRRRRSPSAPCPHSCVSGQHASADRHGHRGAGREHGPAVREPVPVPGRAALVATTTTGVRRLVLVHGLPRTATRATGWSWLGTRGARAGARSTVDRHGLTKVRALPLGRAGVSVVDLPSRATCAGAEPGCAGRSPPVARAVLRRAGDADAQAEPVRDRCCARTITLPAGRFSLARVLSRAAGTRRWLNPRRPPGCTGAATTAAARCPSASRVRARSHARRSYLRSRAGRDRLRRRRQRGPDVRACTSTGRSSPPASSRRCCWSPTCAGWTRCGQHHVDSFSNSFLYPMINVSDNSAATQTWSIVGDSRPVRGRPRRRDDRLLDRRRSGPTPRSAPPTRPSSSSRWTR